VYCDILGFGLLHWSERFAVPIALVEALMIACACGVLIRSRIARAKDVVRGLLLWVALVLTSIAFGAALQTW